MEKLTCIAFSLACAAWSTFAPASEYVEGESDFLPAIEQLRFSDDAVGFVSSARREHDPYGNRTLYFVYERGSRKVIEVDAGQFRVRFPDSAGKKYRRTVGSGGAGGRYSGFTSGTIPYESTLKYCGEGQEDEKDGTPTLAINGRRIPIRRADKCTGVTSAEIVGNQLWLGTAYFGESSNLSQAEGIIVQNLKGNALVARIDAISGPVTSVVLDPVSGDVWAITDLGIYEISPQLAIRSANLSYQDFDPDSGQPRYFFASKPAECSQGARCPSRGNPFAAVSRLLPVKDRKAFYEAVQKIPAQDLRQLSHYDFYMCCSDSGSYPASFQPLAPFFVRAEKLAGYPSLYRQALCRMGMPETQPYCERMR